MKLSGTRFDRGVTALLLGVAILCGTSCATSSASGRSLKGHDLDAWTTYLVPDQAENAWRDIPWIPNLAEGVHAARESGRPLLLWMMNGHPLGCT